MNKIIIKTDGKWKIQTKKGKRTHALCSEKHKENVCTKLKKNTIFDLY